MKDFLNLHLHTDFSNTLTIPEVVNKVDHYIERYKQDGATAIVFTEHGNILSWTDKKNKANKAGLKYIHGMEAYVTESLDEKIRDNYHLILLAKNKDGVDELNRMSSKSFYGQGNKESDDNHFYYVPRISFGELEQTSDNILILTGCLGGPLWQNHRNNYHERLDMWLQFFIKNKHRVWLEVQPHNTGEQKVYNKVLSDWSKEHGLKLVATNDVHAIDERSDKARKILMKSKSVSFGDSEEDEEGLELWLKNYDEMVQSFQEQGVLSYEEITSALDETIKIADSITDFEFDLSFKYPKIFDDSEKVLQRKIKEGYIARGFDKKPRDEQKLYLDQIKYEYSVYKDMGAVDYILLMNYIIEQAIVNDVHVGYARGSVSGSLIALLLNVIEVDPIKESLSFSRFLNPARLNLSDVDTDAFKDDRDWIINFMMASDKFNTSAIITYNTLGVKGAIKDISRAMDIDYSIANQINKDIDANDGRIPQRVKDEYPELIEMVETVIGVVVSIGRHAGGFVVTTDDIESEMGTIRVKTSEHPLSTIAMGEVEGRFYVKLDMLGLDNIGLVNKTCELAGIERVTPMSDINFNDKAVIEDIARSTVGIFQFEADRAQDLVRKMFDEDVQQKMVDSGVNTNAVNQLAFLSAAMRPGAASLISDIVKGNVKDNGHEALNKLLEDTLGYLIYQESQIEFLTTFCGRDSASADLIRRAIGHKIPEVLEVEIPKIKEEFVETMVAKYGETEEHAREIVEPFIKIFQDAADYSFSRNHAIPYSYLGYISAWLRYYYPLEFLTVSFSLWNDDNPKINRLTEYALSRGINVSKFRYRRSKGDYYFDRGTNTIYEGIFRIKGMNEKVADYLYDSSFNEDGSPKQFDSFVHFLLDITDPFDVYYSSGTMDHLDLLCNSNSIDDFKAIDKEVKEAEKSGTRDSYVSEDKYEDLQTPNLGQMQALIRLGYFDEFGGSLKLEKIFDFFKKKYNKSNKTLASKAKNIRLVMEYADTVEDEQYSLYDKANYELQYLEKCTIQDSRIPSQYAVVTKIHNVRKNYASVHVHSINKGVGTDVKIGIKLYRNVPVKAGDIIEIQSSGASYKNVLIDGKWQKSTTEKEMWINQMKYVRKGSKDK